MDTRLTDKQCSFWRWGDDHIFEYLSLCEVHYSEFVDVNKNLQISKRRQVIIKIITKLLLRQYPRKESSSVPHLEQGVGQINSPDTIQV